MNKTFKILSVIFSFMIIVLSICYGKNVAFSEQKELYSIMLTIASIVLAITGIWMAIVFPDRLRGNIDEHLSLTKTRRPIGSFFKPLIYSTFVVISAFLILLLAQIASAVPFFLQFKELGRAFSLVILCFLGALSIYSLYLTISLANDIKTDSDSEDVRQETIKNHIAPENIIEPEEIENIHNPD